MFGTVDPPSATIGLTPSSTWRDLSQQHGQDQFGAPVLGQNITKKMYEKVAPHLYQRGLCGGYNGIMGDQPIFKIKLIASGGT